MCEQFSFCKRVSSQAQLSAMHVASQNLRPRRLRRSVQHVLVQRGSIVQQDTLADDEELDVIEYADADRVESEAPQKMHLSPNEL